MPEVEPPISSPEIVTEVPPDTVDAAIEDVEDVEDIEQSAPSSVEASEEIDEPTLQVEIVFAEDCWTEVIDANGERLFYGLGSAGARTRFAATPPLSFFLGNAKWR